MLSRSLWFVVQEAETWLDQASLGCCRVAALSPGVGRAAGEGRLQCLELFL